MSLVYALNLLTIILIIFIISGLSYFLSGAKYSLIKAFYRGIKHRDMYYFKWFYNNSIYIWCKILVVLLICTNLSLITQFSQESIFQKPLFIFGVSPLLWGVITIVGFITFRAYIRLRNN